MKFEYVARSIKKVKERKTRKESQGKKVKERWMWKDKLFRTLGRKCKRRGRFGSICREANRALDRLILDHTILFSEISLPKKFLVGRVVWFLAHVDRCFPLFVSDFSNSKWQRHESRISFMQRTPRDTEKDPVLAALRDVREVWDSSENTASTWSAKYFVNGLSKWDGTSTTKV